MSKLITLLFAVVALVYVFLLYNFRIADPANSFNQGYRDFFLKSKITRILFFLNSPGDGRFEYFSPKKKSILVEIDYQVGRRPNDNVKQWIESMIFGTLGKEAEVQITEEGKMPDLDGFSDREMRELAKETQDWAASEGASYLHVVYVSESMEVPSNTGLVLTANDFFIFKDRIDDLSKKSNTQALIEESTIKHEFGHILGLEHVLEANCVMSEGVEVYERRKYQFEAIPTEYCEESLEELERLKERSS
jgi:hypothetical protein